MPAVGVLVCVKRVPDSTEEVVLTDDAQSVDGRRSGFTMSAHEECAVEIAVQTTAAGGGEATVLTIGDADAVEQLRTALAVGCTAATHVVGEQFALGPADVAREIAAVVTDHAAAGRSHDLVLLGNDASDTGDFQVGIRLAYELGRPVVNGASTVAVEDGPDGPVVVAVGEGPDGQETYRVPLPAVVTIREGGVEPRYPSVPGRLKAKKIEIEERQATSEPKGPSRVRLVLPPPTPSAVQILGEGPEAAPAVVDVLEKLGVLEQMILTLVETDLDGAAIEVSLEALTFARDLSAAGNGVPVDAVVIGDVSEALRAELASYGVRTLHRVAGDDVSAYSGAGWASAIQTVLQAAGSIVLMAAGTDRGNELMAHVAARSGADMAANVLSFSGLSPFVVTRQVVGGAAMEEMNLHQRPAVFTVAGHAVEAKPADAGGAAEVVEHTPTIAAADLVARVVSTAQKEADESGDLTSAKVVVGAGRGVGGADRFDDVLELTDLLGGSLGVSRVVTSAGWRPHHEQVGQTGSRISPDLYIPCGISGAIQHWAGCSSAKTILAINSDEEAPMVTRATYAVIGDLHEILPAISAEIRSRGYGG